MYPTKNLSQIHNSLLNTTHTEHKVGIIFDEHPTFSPFSKYCYIHMCKLLCTCPYLDSNTASTTANSNVHSKLDYCNSLYYKLPKSQINRLQQIRANKDLMCL